MTLHEKAYLLVEDSDTEYVFEFRPGLEHASSIEKSPLMGGAGQYITEIFNQTPIIEVDSETKERRRGFYIDGGAGSWQETITFDTGPEEGENLRWGDGNSSEGQANVTATDASGAGIKPLSRKNVIELCLASTITDSTNPGRLYAGEWTDGRFEGTAGAMGIPMPVAIDDLDASTDLDEPGVLQGSFTVSHLTPFGDAIPDWMQGGVADFFGQFADLLAGNPDG